MTFEKDLHEKAFDAFQQHAQTMKKGKWFKIRYRSFPWKRVGAWLFGRDPIGNKGAVCGGFATGPDGPYIRYWVCRKTIWFCGIALTRYYTKPVPANDEPSYGIKGTDIHGNHLRWTPSGKIKTYPPSK